MQPIDYVSGFGPPPAAGFASAMEAGQRFGMMEQQQAAIRAREQMAQQEAAFKLQQQQAASLRQQMIEKATQELLANPNRTATDVARVGSMMFDEKQQASLRADFDLFTKEQQQRELSFMGQAYSSLVGGQQEIAAKLIRERATALRNRGEEGKADALEALALSAEVNPVGAEITLSGLLNTLPGGDKVIEGVGKAREQRRQQKLEPFVVSKAQSDAEKAASDARFADALNQAGLNERNWNVRNVQNQINVRSRQLALDETKTAADVQLTLARIAETANSLPDQAKKDINTAAVAAGTSKQQSIQFNSLADRIEQAGGGFGVLSRANEFFRTATGNQDYLSQLRQEFTRLRNSAAVQSLPPGPATDKDIQLVLEGFPPPTADARVMASFLRGMAKIQDITAATENARVDWLAANRGSLGRARSEFRAGDFSARPGETWVDLSQRIAADVSRRYSGGAPQAPIPTTPQMVPGAAPTAPQMPAGFRILPAR
jgi:hypothetical protein